MEISEEIKGAKDIIQAFLKAKKTVRMYPENNPVYTKTIDEIFSRFTDFFAWREEFRLRIKQHELFFDAEMVYQNPEKEDNLALFLFKDGLRELSFKKNLSKQELEEFLKIIALDFDREAADDDIVTLLWERDFQDIQYVVDEAFLTEDNDYESDAIEEIKSKAPETDNLFKAYTDAFSAEDVSSISIVNLSDKDLQQLVREIEKDLEDKTGKLSEILFEMLHHAESPPELEDIYHFLSDIILYSLRQGDLKTVVTMLKRAQAVAESPSVSKESKTRMKGLADIVNSRDSLMHLGAILDSSEAIDENLLSEFTSFLDKVAIAPLISLLGDLESIHGRKQIITILISLGKKDLQALAKGLQDSRWYVVRNIIYVLHRIGDKKAVEYLLSTARHADVRVRKESIKALGELKSPLALQTLRDCLDDKDDSIRKMSAKALGSIGSETAKRILIEKVSGKDFKARDFEEKKEFFEALTRWKDAEVTDFMMKLLKKRSLFKRARSDEDRAAAAHYFGLIGSRDALPALSALKDSKNELVREYVNSALKRIDYGK